MRTLIKAICLGWPLLLLLISCSSHKKQFYYFDHHQYSKAVISNVEIKEVEVKIDTPVYYTSINPVIIKQEKKIVQKPSVQKKQDSIPEQKIQKKKKLKNFGIAAIALSPVAAIVSFFSWPVGIVIAGIAIVFSMIAFWSDKKLLAIIAFVLALLAMIVALMVMSYPILQNGNDGIGPIF